MSIGKGEFRRVMGHFATGVTIITTIDPAGKPVGLTANSVASVSLDPPSLLFCLDRGADCFDAFETTDRFAVNVLSEDQQELSTRFATKGGDKFRGVEHRLSERGSPLLEGATGHLDCRIVGRHRIGDHVIYVGEVDAGNATADLPPLLFFRGAYWRITD